jgi:NitT/TauT family transport system substrate-binding protein
MPKPIFLLGALGARGVPCTLPTKLEYLILNHHSTCRISASSHRAQEVHRSFFDHPPAVAGVIGVPNSFAQEAPPETTILRLPKFSTTICGAPVYIAEELLRAEGFTDIRYVPTDTGTTGAQLAARGEVDFDNAFTGSIVILIDAGERITMFGGLHIGCYELFAHEGIRSIRELKGKTLGVPHLGSSAHTLASSMAAYVGLDPAKDIRWVVNSSTKAMELFTEGKIDAFLGFPPEPQELRARNIGHVILNTATDRPWSQYFCCALAGNRDFVRSHPVATKRALRAVLKATDFCAAEPARAAQIIVDSGFTGRHDYALQTLKEIPYAKWREYDPEDALRFYSLRLREVGMIKSTPNKIIADGTDWRFFNQLKRELKG